MRRKFVAYNDRIVIGVRIDGRKIRLGGGRSGQVMFNHMLSALSAQGIEAERSDSKECRRRWTVDLTFVNAAAVELAERIWRDMYLTKDVNCFRRLMR